MTLADTLNKIAFILVFIGFIEYIRTPDNGPNQWIMLLAGLSLIWLIITGGSRIWRTIRD